MAFMKQPNYQMVPAVLTPLDEHMGLDIARTLAKRGIPVYGIDSDPNTPGKYSKYCHFLLGPNPEIDNELDYVQFLAEFGKKLDSKAVLYPLSDLHVLICSRHRSMLQNYYEYVMPDHDIMVRLTTKDGLQMIVKKYNIPAPITIQINANDNIRTIAENITYPAILKPSESTYWHTPEITRLLRRGMLTGRAKVILCNQPNELIRAYNLISVFDTRLVVQEVIPGEDKQLVYISFYMDRQSKPLGIFAGRKYRIIPTGFGSASYVRSINDPVLEDIALNLLSTVSYQGLGGIEFKKDLRDNQYKLIEFNTRFGMWDGLGVVCGVDLAYIAYCDALKLPVDPIFSYREEVIWLDWQRDVRAAIEYMRKGQITLGDWIKSLRGEKMWAIYNKDDWRPGVAFTLNLFKTMWERLRTH